MGSRTVGDVPVGVRASNDTQLVSCGCHNKMPLIWWLKTIVSFKVPRQGRSRCRYEHRAICLCLSRPPGAAGSPRCSGARGCITPILWGPQLNPPQILWTHSPAQDICAPAVPPQVLHLLPRAFESGLAGGRCGDSAPGRGDSVGKGQGTGLHAASPDPGTGGPLEQVGLCPAHPLPPGGCLGALLGSRKHAHPCTHPSWCRGRRLRPCGQELAGGPQHLWAGPGRSTERRHLLWARGPGKPVAGASPAPTAQSGPG